MKAIKTVIFLLFSITALLIGCVKEDLDDCPTDYNLVLCFEYYDGNRKDIFTERIYAIDVLIYDADFKLYSWFEADEVIESPTRRKELLLPSGDYYIISWANNYLNRPRRHLPALTDTLKLGRNLIYHNFNTLSSDELHYAPYLRECWCDIHPEDDDYKLYRVTIGNKDVTHHTLSYMSAHCTINVYLKGFDSLVRDANAENPNIAMTNLAENYNDFLNRNGEDMVTYRKVSEEIIVEVEENTEEKLGFATFFVPHFDNESPVTLDITGEHLSGEPYHYTLDMDYILTELGIEVEDGDDVVIDILVELISGTYVQVKVPSWKVNEVDPGFGFGVY